MLKILLFVSLLIPQSPLYAQGFSGPDGMTERGMSGAPELKFELIGSLFKNQKEVDNYNAKLTKFKNDNNQDIKNFEKSLQEKMQKEMQEMMSSGGPPSKESMMKNMEKIKLNIQIELKDLIDELSDSKLTKNLASDETEITENETEETEEEVDEDVENKKVDCKHKLALNSSSKEIEEMKKSLADIKKILEEISAKNKNPMMQMGQNFQPQYGMNQPNQFMGSGQGLFGQNQSMGMGQNPYGQNQFMGMGQGPYGQNQFLGLGQSPFGQNQFMGMGQGTFGQNSFQFR